MPEAEVAGLLKPPAAEDAPASLRGASPTKRKAGDEPPNSPVKSPRGDSQKASPRPPRSQVVAVPATNDHDECGPSSPVTKVYTQHEMDTAVAMAERMAERMAAASIKVAVEAAGVPLVQLSAANAKLSERMGSLLTQLEQKQLELAKARGTVTSRCLFESLVKTRGQMGAGGGIGQRAMQLWRSDESLRRYMHKKGAKVNMTESDMEAAFRGLYNTLCGELHGVPSYTLEITAGGALNGSECAALCAFFSFYFVDYLYVEGDHKKSDFFA